MGGSIWEGNGDIEDTASHEALATFDLKGEVVLGVVGGDGEGRKDGKAACCIASAGVDSVWEIKSRILETGLEVFEIFGSANFANAEDVGLFVDDDFDESLDFPGVL